MFRQLGSTVVETDLNRLKELAKQEALDQTAAERSAILENFRSTQRQGQLAQIFRTPVTRNGKLVILSDNEANVAVLESLLNPGEEVTLAWFNTHYNEAAFDRLAWEPWLTPTQRKAQSDRKRQIALRLCHENNLSEAESNVELLSGALNESNGLLSNNGTIVWANSTPYLFSDTGEFQLIPANQEELAERSQQAFKQRQRTLVELRDSDSPESFTRLRQMARQDAERKSQPENIQLTKQQQLEQELVRQYERDTLVGFTTSLPRHVTADFIRKLDSNGMLQLMKRYGRSRVTAKIYNITSIPDGHGGVIRFE